MAGALSRWPDNRRMPNAVSLPRAARCATGAQRQAFSCPGWIQARAVLCFALAGEHVAEQTLAAYLDVFTHHYLQAKNQLPIAWEGAAHQRLREVSLLLLPRVTAQGMTS